MDHNVNGRLEHFFNGKGKIDLRGSYASYRNELDEYISSISVKSISHCRENDCYNSNFFDGLMSLNESESSFSECVASLVAGQGFTLPDPYNNSKVVVSNKSYCSQLKSFVEFKSESKSKIFYVVQNHQFVAGVFFPVEKKYIRIAGGSVPGYLKFLLSSLLSFPDKASSVCFDPDRSTFPIVSCPRPWHFFYNFGTAVSILCKHSVSIDRTYYMPGGDFLDLSAFFDNIGTYDVLSSEILNSVNSFGFLLGYSYDGTSKDAHDYFGGVIKESYESHAAGGLSRPSRVWVGITSQKRSLENQVECISALLSRLSESGKPIVVLVDGWTSPLTPSKNDMAQIDSDLNVMMSLVREMSDNRYVSFSSVIGLTAKQKLEIASTVDFYVSNYASGSLFVSRFMRRPGISHLNNSMPREHQVHYRNYEIPYHFVHDVVEEGKTGHHVSYRIDPECFTLSVIEGLSALEVNFNEQ